MLYNDIIFTMLKVEDIPDCIAKLRRPSPTVPPELRCIENIAPKDNWIVKIGNRRMNFDYLLKNDVWNRRTQFWLADGFFPKRRITPSNKLDHLLFYEFADSDPVHYFGMMEEECLKSTQVLYGLAERLSGPSVEKVCFLVFNKPDVSSEFIDMFYRLFFPAYLKRHYNWFSLSLLIRAHVACPRRFKVLVQDLMRDLLAPSNIMLDYAGNLSTEKKTELMTIVSGCNLNNVQFCHNLKFICALFNECDKNQRIYDHLVIHLEFHAEYCTFNKDYGRLLLALLNNMPSANGRQKLLRKLIDMHGSCYKAACIAVQDDMISEMLHLQYQLMVPSPRIFIPREPVPSRL